MEESLASQVTRLGDGDLFVDDSGVVALHVGPQTFHPLSAAVPSFVLLFRADPGLPEVTSEVVLHQQDDTYVFPVGAPDASLLAELRATRRVRPGCVLPVGGEAETRALLARVQEELLAPLDMPLLALADGDRYLGVCVGEDDVTVLQSIQVSSPSEEDDDELEKAMLEWSGAPVAHTRAMACYDLLGSPTLRGSWVSLVVHWSAEHNAPIRLLACPNLQPERAALIVRGAPVAGEQATQPRGGTDGEHLGRGDSEATWRPIPPNVMAVLQRMSAFSAAEAKPEAVSGPEVWARFVSDFMEAASSGSLFSEPTARDCDEDPSGPAGGGGGPVAVGHERRVTGTARDDLDFTEHFWDKVVVRARSLPQLLYALREVVAALSAGKLLPFVHKTNATLLGSLCRQALQSHGGGGGGGGSGSGGGEDAAPSDSLETLKRALAASSIATPTQQAVVTNVLELGLWKVERDLEAWLRELGMEPGALEHLFPLESEGSGQTGKEGSRLARLANLDATLQTAWTAQALRCPAAEVKALAEASARIARDGLLEPGLRPTFVVELKAQLPWVRDDAAGTAPLPAARWWQIDRKDRQGRAVQTARVTPQESQASAAGQLSEDVARRALAMLRHGESAVHGLLAREYARKEAREMLVLQSRTCK